ncbi:hypothetical protein D3Y59_00220 [Hymenobacter oligotrophus]|uniref:Glycosyltransferase RgtA/B/C/D-like domain-containing protein n=1 Tax=Hymenobacter oligotrophus TaxID=2319843 RepID=A0A3B7QWK0_9BACT|nr:hypothetical protein D3Y59_00220 [Hymenobacter oligotrophus]
MLAVAVLRLWGLPSAALPDYDSVRNWQIIQEVAQLDWRHIFHHGSPGFYLFFAPVTWLSTDYRVYLVLNALVGVAALGVFMSWIAQAARLRGPETALLALLAGSSVFLTFSGRDFTMSSLSLLALAGLMRAHWRRLQVPTRRNLLRSAGWLALGLTINYKFLLTAPILLVLELLQADGLLWRRGNWWRVLLVVALPFVVLGVLAWVLSGVPLWRWPAVYFVIMFPAAANAAGRQGTVQVDFSYYLRYLTDFESPFLLPALGMALVWFGADLRQRPTTMGAYLLVWAACTLAGMSLLIKAPRGLLFGYIPMYALPVLLLQKWPRSVALVLLVLALGYNGWQVQRQVLAYAPSSYPQVAAWLKQRQIARVATSVGIGLAPAAAPQQITVAGANNLRQLAALRRQGFRYLLLDDYYRVAGVQPFDTLRRAPYVAAWPEPLLRSPLLYLEHSEYTGLGYQATLQRQQQAARDTLQLRLIDLSRLPLSEAR